MKITRNIITGMVVEKGGDVNGNISGQVRVGGKCALKYVMFTQSIKSTELLAPSDCSEWLTLVLILFYVVIISLDN